MDELLEEWDDSHLNITKLFIELATETMDLLDVDTDGDPVQFFYDMDEGIVFETTLDVDGGAEDNYDEMLDFINNESDWAKKYNIREVTSDDVIEIQNSVESMAGLLFCFVFGGFDSFDFEQHKADAEEVGVSFFDHIVDIEMSELLFSGLFDMSEDFILDLENFEPAEGVLLIEDEDIELNIEAD